VSVVAVADAKVMAGVAPRAATVRRIVEEAFETYTYWVTLDDPADRRAYRFEPGQINMIGIPGVGEVPISVSSDPDRPQRLAHTIRACGKVTDRFKQLVPGDNTWAVRSAVAGRRGTGRGPRDRGRGRGLRRCARRSTRRSASARCSAG
jgi:NAD(P)H-flavin reductase